MRFLFQEVVCEKFLMLLSISGLSTRSFNLKISAGIRAGRHYGEYSFKVNEMKKCMKGALDLYALVHVLGRN